jgi:hypothetical protein
VRLIMPIASTKESAFATLASFSAQLAPHLDAHIP